MSTAAVHPEQPSHKPDLYAGRYRTATVWIVLAILYMLMGVTLFLIWQKGT